MRFFPSFLLWLSCLAGCAVLGTSFSISKRQLSSSYQVHLKNHGTSCRQRRYETSLSMGLRSFIKTKLGDKLKSGKKKKVEPVGPPKVMESVAKPVIRTTIPEAVQEETTSTDDDLPPFYQEETVQDRINRVKSGKMTDEEKQAFLRTALTAKDTTVSRKPLRQALPREEDSKGDRPKKHFTVSASPFPKDTLLRNFVRGNRNSTSEADPKEILASARNLKDGASLASQKKKQEYLEMVTNPNRFHSYKSSTVDLSTAMPAVDTEEVQDEAVEDAIDEQDDSADEEESTSGQMDLGKRLEAAAIAHEHANKAKAEERAKDQLRREQQQAERKKALEEQNRIREAELAKQKLEAKARQREKEEAEYRAKEERRKVEEARLRELQEKQDEYWKQKLKKERDARMNQMDVEGKKQLLRQEAELEARQKQAQKAKDEAAAEAARSYEAPPSENPNFPVIKRTANDILGKKTGLAEKNRQHKMESQAFRDELARKKAELDRQKEEQLARLKALNSPVTGNVRATSSPPTEADQTAPSTPIPSLREMMKLDSPTPSSDEVAAGNPLTNLWGGSGGTKPQSPPPHPPKKEPTKRQVIRQELPLGDEDDDFDTFARNGPNKNMSIGDAMKKAGAEIQQGDQEERSKKWGIDMTRINKSLEEEGKR